MVLIGFSDLAAETQCSLGNGYRQRETLVTDRNEGPRASRRSFSAPHSTHARFPSRMGAKTSSCFETIPKAGTRATHGLRGTSPRAAGLRGVVLLTPPREAELPSEATCRPRGVRGQAVRFHLQLQHRLPHPAPLSGFLCKGHSSPWGHRVVPRCHAATPAHACRTRGCGRTRRLSCGAGAWAPAMSGPDGCVGRPQTSPGAPRRFSGSCGLLSGCAASS